MKEIDKSELPSVVCRYIEAWESGDTSKLAEILSPTVRYSAINKTFVRTQGIDGVREIMREIHALLRGIRVEIYKL